jgi:hypothetical protein
VRSPSCACTLSRPARTAELPALQIDATYVALAPFIGAQSAAAYATQQENRVPRSRR